MKPILRILILVLISPCLSPAAFAERPRIYAITDVRIVTAPGQVIDQGSIVLRDGLIEAVGAGITIPPDADIIAGEENWTVYPAFIDAAAQWASEDESSSRPSSRGGDSARPGSPHELKAVHPETAIIDKIDTANENITKPRDLGFGVAQYLPEKGVFRGHAAILALREGPAAALVLQDRAAQVVMLESSSFMARQYPSSKIGAMATVRQSLLDAERMVEWKTRYESNPKGMQRPEFRSSDEALMNVVQRETPVIFVSNAALDPSRFGGLAKEFNVKAMTVAQGLHNKVGDLATAEMPILLPLAMPEKPELDTDDDAREVSLETMQAYINAAHVPSDLAKANIDFAFVTYGMKSIRDVPENLQMIIEKGLSEDQTLAALTTTPAALLGLENVLGTLEAGKIANLIMVDGDLFVKKPAFKHIFVDGYHEEIKEEDTKGDPNAVVDPRGTWEVSSEVMGRSSESTWTIEGSDDAWSGYSESERAGKSDFDSVELVGNALTVTRSSPNGDMDITVIIEEDKFEGDTELESPRGSVKMSVEGRRLSGPEGEEQ